MRLAVGCALILVAGLGLRIWAAGSDRPIHRDGLHYISIARAIGHGDWALAASRDYPPGYPALIAAGASLVGADVGPRPVATSNGGHHLSFGTADGDRHHIRAAQAVSLTAGMLTLLALAYLAWQLAPAAAPWALAIAALHPGLGLYSGFVLSEALFILMSLSALSLGCAALGRQRRGASFGWGVAAGLAMACAYLVRPEGLVVGLAIGCCAVCRRKLAVIAGLTAPLLAAIAALASALTSTHDTWTLSGKKSLGWLAERLSADPLATLAHAGRNLALVFEHGHPLIMLLAALGIGWCWRHKQAGPALSRTARTTLALLLTTFILYVPLVSIVRADKRFALTASAFLIPLAALAIAHLAHLAAARWRYGALACLAVVALSTLPIWLHKTRPQKTEFLAMAAHLHSVSKSSAAQPVLASYDPRLAYYGTCHWHKLSATDVGVVQMAAALDGGEIDYLALRRDRAPSLAQLSARLQHVRLLVVETADGERKDLQLLEVKR